MNRLTDNDDLLADVFSETAPADFRDAMLGQTLRLAGRRRRFQQTRRAISVLAVFGLLAGLVWQNWPEQPIVSKPLAKKTAQTNYRLVRTQQLPNDAIVTTRQFSVQLVASTATVVQVATTSGGFRPINDNELLALVSGRPAVLIRTGPHSEELVFANPEDQKGFPLN
ncbi:MAG TPA: hypothetical protein VE344_08565 [Methylomirabilota bacterium]|nr:hypothetical protein [Methylomirabilota bacterium]